MASAMQGTNEPSRSKYDCEIGRNLRAIEEARTLILQQVTRLRRIADAALGSVPEKDAPSQPPTAAPNGLLSEMEAEIMGLGRDLSDLDLVTARLSKLV